MMDSAIHGREERKWVCMCVSVYVLDLTGVAREAEKSQASV